MTQRRSATDVIRAWPFDRIRLEMRERGWRWSEELHEFYNYPEPNKTVDEAKAYLGIDDTMEDLGRTLGEC